MKFTRTFKVLAAAATFAMAGSAANAMTVAEATSSGSFALLDLGGVDALAIDGTFNASFDPTFDPTVERTFRFEFDFAATGLPTIDEELVVPGITGNDILSFALFVLDEIDFAFPSAIDAVITEVFDGDIAQTEIVPGVFLGVDGTLNTTASSADGAFFAVLSEAAVDPTGLFPLVSPLQYTVSGKISIVPLPATLPLLASAGIGLFLVGRRRRT